MPNNRFKKVLVIHWGFIPGGGATYARYFQDIEKYAPIVIKNLLINAPGWPLDQISMQNLNFILIKIKGRWDLSWFSKTRSILKKECPDLIFVNGFNSGFVAMLSNLGLHIPIVSVWHGEYYPTTITQKFRKPFFELISKLLFRYVVKEIVTVSHFSKDILSKKGINPKKITVIHNGLPRVEITIFNKRTEIRNKLNIPQEALLYGTICRLASEKGLEWFLRTILKVVKFRSDLRFVIWGDGPKMKSLQQLVKNLRIKEYVALPGYTSDPTNCLCALDVFFLSSSAENFPISLLEAMRAGLPIITTGVGGVPEAVKDGVHAIIIPFGDDKALEKTILRLAENPHLRKILGENARQRFNEEFTSDRMIKKTAKWLLKSAEILTGKFNFS